MAMDQTVKQNVRTLVNTFYMTQKLRIQTGNRICRNFASQLGQEDGMPQDELAPEAQEVLTQLKAEYKLLATGLAVRSNLRRQREALATHNGIMTSPYEFSMVRAYVDLESNEEQLGKDIAALIQEHPLWEGFLKGVKGIGPILAAVIVAEFDINKPYVSNFWKYAGLDVAEDGKGRSRRAEHLVTYQYKNKKGEDAERQGITFNMFLRTKLIGVAGPCLLRAGGAYSQVYREYKHRLESHPKYGIMAEEEFKTAVGERLADLKLWSPTKLHRHNMAVRYMVKMFLLDLHVTWRGIEGLPINKSYQEEKLGHEHGGAYGNQHQEHVS